MIGKPVALIQVPNQRLFGPAEAARYLGVSRSTLVKLADKGKIRCRQLERRRMFTLEELDRFIETLPAFSPIEQLEPLRRVRSGNLQSA